MPSSSRPRRNPALRLAAVRQWHTYLGVLIAPSVLFFAVTGSLQLFSLHEAHGGYRPPAIVEGLASVHKDQVYKIRPPQPEAEEDVKPAAKPSHPPSDGARKPKSSGLALKVLFLAVAAGLVISTCLGLWMALAYGRHKALLWGLLAAGIVLPILLVVF